MNYEDPTLRELLAGRYVLGVMHRRARARLERLMARDASLSALVSEWSDRLAPLDLATPSEAPPERVWRNIEARLGSPKEAPSEGWFSSLFFWRGLAGVASAVAVALALYVAGFQSEVLAPMPSFVAVLNDRTGAPAWIASTGTRHEEVLVAAIGRQTIDADHAFELWAIAGGKPRPLGLLPAQPDRHLTIATSALPPTGGILAVSVEPAGGSPSGQPTGPVLYQGKVFSNPL